jgi:NADP-dependent 3-hydroxy acid dehydrogenase YdfG
LKQVPGVEIIQTEITQQSGIDKVIKELNGQKLNIVLNNAGVYPTDNLETLTFEALSQV